MAPNVPAQTPQTTTVILPKSKPHGLQIEVFKHFNRDTNGAVDEHDETAPPGQWRTVDQRLALV